MNAYGAYGLYGSNGTDVVTDAGTDAEGKTAADYAWLGPLVSGLTGQFTDPVREAEVLRVELANAVARGRPLQTIQKLQARLIAAERRAERQIETESTLRSWNQVGQVAAVAGIVLVLAGVAYVGVRAYKGR